MPKSRTYTGGVADTSIQAYWEEKLSFRLGKQAAAVLDNLHIYGPGTRAELAARCDLKINVICGRVNELIAAGAAEEEGTKRDPTSGKNVKIVQIKGETCDVH